MRSSSSRLQVVALMLAAALGLHEARYLLAVGPSAGGHTTSVHAYFSVAIPVLGALGTLALALFVRRVALGTASAAPVPMRRTWLLATSGLLALYVCQESAESFVASGPRGVLDAPFAGGGWLALAMAPVFGAVVAYTLRGARAIAALVARRTSAVKPSRTQPGWPRWTDARPARLTLARHLAARGPPFLSS